MKEQHTAVFKIYLPTKFTELLAIRALQLQLEKSSTCRLRHFNLYSRL